MAKISTFDTANKDDIKNLYVSSIVSLEEGTGFLNKKLKINEYFVDKDSFENVRIALNNLQADVINISQDYVTNENLPDISSIESDISKLNSDILNINDDIASIKTIIDNDTSRITAAESSLNDITTILSAKADINSPTLTGTPKTSTPDGKINDQIANVEYVDSKLSQEVMPTPSYTRYKDYPANEFITIIYDGYLLCTASGGNGGSGYGLCITFKEGNNEYESVQLPGFDYGHPNILLPIKKGTKLKVFSRSNTGIDLVRLFY